MDQFDTFTAIYQLAERGESIPDDLRQSAAKHGIRVEAIVDTVASLSTAVGENDFDE